MHVALFSKSPGTTIFCHITSLSVRDLRDYGIPLDFKVLNGSYTHMIYLEKPQ